MVRILAYHAVTDRAVFEEQLDYLASEYRPVSLEAVERTLTSGKTLPQRAVLITFDDGDRSVLEVAAPLLYSRGIPSVAFLIAGLIGTEDPAWWQEVEHHMAAGGHTKYASGNVAEVLRQLKVVDNALRLAAIEEIRMSSSARRLRRRQLDVHELQQLESMGVAIGNHTWSHPCLDRCEDDLVNYEIGSADSALRELCGHDITAFAYPNGNQDARVRAAVLRAGYKVAFCFDHQLTRVPPRDPMQISRLRVDASTPLERFHLILSGLHPTLHRAIGRQ